MFTRRKILALLIAMLLICQVTCPGLSAKAAGQLTFQVDSTTADKGDTGVTVDIKALNNTKIASVNLSVAYDESRLKLKNIVYNNSWGGQSMQPQTKNSPVTLIWYDGANNYTTTDSTFATLSFDVLENADSGNANITITCDPENIYMLDEENVGETIDVDHTISNGSIVVNSTPMNSVSVTVGVPEKGQTLAAAVTCGSSAYTGEVVWYEGNSASGTPVSGTAKPETVYTAKITLTPAVGENFGNSVAVTVNSDAVQTISPSNGKIIVTKTFPITGDKDTPTCETPTGLIATYGQTLADIELENPVGNTPGTWNWANPSQSVGDAGEHTFKAIFTPTDTETYATVNNVDVSVTVNAKLVTPSVTVTPAAYDYTGQAITPTTVTVKDGTATIPPSEYSLSYTDNTNAGKATVTVSDVNGGNYIISQATANFTINQIPGVIEIFDPATIVYDGVAVECGDTRDLNYAYTGDGVISVKWYADNNGQKGSEISAPIDAGTYWIGVSAAAGINYSGTSEVTRKFAITKATITGYQTAAPTATILANNANNEANKLKAAANLPANVTITYKDGVESLPITWANATEKFNVKGGTYTFKGTVTPGTNFNAYSTPLTATLTVTPITGTLATALTSPVVIAKSAAEKATSYADFKLPGSVTINCDNGVAAQTITPTWSVSLADLKKKALNSKTTVKVTNVPEWLTIGELTVEVQITDKFPVTVSVTQSGTTYGTPLSDPVATQTAIDDGTDGSATFSYQYTGTTAAGKTYNSADKPTEAGDYTVTATLVSDTHAGSGEADFTIAPKALTDSMVAAILNETYNKEAHKPTVVVTDGTALKLGTDYTVTYQNNVNAGTATAVVAGKWNYTGTVNKNFTIDKASLTTLTPTISGTAQVGKVLTANLEGVADSELTYQWKRGGTDITGATAKTYLLTTADSNKEITVVLTAKGSGNYTGSTLASEGVTVEKQAISGTVTITEANTTGTAGTIDEGDTLTAVTSGITPAATFTYQWYRGEEAIDSATSATYTVTAADADKTLKVVVTAGGDFQGEVEASVEVGKAVLTGTPTISGASTPAAVGDELTVSFATGTEGADYTVVWLRDGEPISGAEGTTYTLTAEDQGKTVSAKLVGKGTYTGEVVSTGVAVPAAAPAKPALSLSAGNGKLTASWAKPADNGAAILSYTLTITDKASYNETVTLSPDDTSYEFTDLTNGTKYTVTLKATNSVGDSSVDTQAATPKAGGSIGGGGGGSTTPEPVVTPGMDDSTISTLTEDDGTVTTTTTWPDGKESAAVVTPDGDVSIVVKNAEGETVTDVTIPAVIPDTGKKYDDVHTGDWFEENVYKTTNLGLFAGTSESKFSPQMNLNRGMLVTVLYRMSGEPKFGIDKNAFPDIAGTEWYADAADWANAMSVAAGTGKGFEPKKDITRQDMVTLIYRYAKAIGLNPVESASLSKFKDGAKTSDYAQPAMQWAVSVGIISGKGNGVLDPRGNATRAEVATVLANFIKYLQK